ncbi:MAG: sigma-70 family RNA polymerase sigma factor [Planctomycetota bacterium]
MDHSIPVEELLAHEGWLRRLILELVDEHEAEDILQETWVAALGRPKKLRSAKAWLAQAARNLALEKRRSAGRRRRREHVAARDEVLPATDAMVERLQAQRRVADAITDLEEPYRTALLLRFFEELPPREVARRLGLPSSTVRSRIQRGIERLRGRLEGTDIRALAAVILAPRSGETLIPLSLGARALTLGAGVLTMSTHYKFAATIAVLGSLSAIALRHAWATDGPNQPTSTLPVVRAQIDPAPPMSPREVPVAGRTTVAGPAEATADASLIRGRVLDTRGAPIPAAPIVFYPGTGAIRTHGLAGVPRDRGTSVPFGASDAAGRFERECAHRHGQIRTTGDQVALRYFVPGPQDRADREALVVAARRASVSGVVVDRDGQPIAGATIEARVDGLLDFPEPIDHTHQLALPETASGARGEFTLEDVPAIEELALSVRQTGYEAARLYGFAGRHDLRVELQPEGASRFVVTGTVVDQRGALVPDAHVILGASTATSGRFGEFAVQADVLTKGQLFGAGIPGWQVATQPDLVARLVAGETRIDDVVLRLGPPARSVTGRVVDGKGQPLAGVLLTLRDVVQIRPPMTIEDFVAGRPGGLEYADGHSFKANARTDAGGAFVIEGLADQPYEVFAYHQPSWASTLHRVQAGTSAAELVIDTETRRTFHGVVETRDGAPVAGVRVAWHVHTYRVQGMRTIKIGGTTATDERGRFRLPDVPAGAPVLSVSGPDVVDLDVELHQADPSVPLVLRPWARCRVRVELADVTATRIECLDEDGRPLELERTTGSVSMSGDGWNLRRGRTPILEVSQAARTLRVLRGDQEIARHPVSIAAGPDVQTLRF